MKTKERRNAIAVWLLGEKKPISGDMIAARYKVSRQTVVKDISVLREMGYEVLPTHSGYVLQKSPLAERVFELKHTTEQTEDELSIIVSLGGTVADVFVYHKVYGKLTAPLGIYAQAQIDDFMRDVRDGKSRELMNITGGEHFHTVRAETEEILDKIGAALDAKGYLVKK